MATEKNPSIYYDRGTIGSSDELDEYGVWVKSEPQDFSSISKESSDTLDMSIISLDDLPDMDENLGFSLDDDTIDSLDLPDIEDLSEDLPLGIESAEEIEQGNDEIMLSEDSIGDGFEEIIFDDIDISSEGLEDLSDIDSIISMDDDSFSEDEAITIDDIDEENRSSINFDDVAAFSEDLQEADLQLESDDTNIFPDEDDSFDEDEAITIDDIDEENRSSIDFNEPEDNDMYQDSSESKKEEVSSELLLKIADELSSIRKELSSLKNELSSIKSETPVIKEECECETPSEDEVGFFDKEDDDKIALTDDELDNILNTADFTEEAGEDANIEETIFSDTESLAEEIDEDVSEDLISDELLIDQPDLLDGNEEDIHLSEEEIIETEEDIIDFDVADISDDISLDMDDLAEEQADFGASDILDETEITIEEPAIIVDDIPNIDILPEELEQEEIIESEEDSLDFDISDISLDMDDLAEEEEFDAADTFDEISEEISELSIETEAIEEESVETIDDILDIDILSEEFADISEERNIEDLPDIDILTEEFADTSEEEPEEAFAYVDDLIEASAEVSEDDDSNLDISTDESSESEVIISEEEFSKLGISEDESEEIIIPDINMETFSDDDGVINAEFSFDSLDNDISIEEAEIVEVDNTNEEDLLLEDEDVTSFDDQVEIEDEDLISFDIDEEEIPEEEVIAEKDTEELKQLREEGVRPLTQAPDDISYLQEEDMEDIDLSEAVIDEPDFSDIVENPVTEPSLDDFNIDDASIDLDLEEESLSIEDAESIEEEKDQEDNLEISIPELDDEEFDIEADIFDLEDDGEELETDQIIPEGFVVESEESDLSFIDPDLDFEEVETIQPDDGLVLEQEAIEEDLSILSDDLTVEEIKPSSDGNMQADGLDVQKPGNLTLPQDLKHELKTVLSYMDKLLESLPEEKIEEFARSEYFDTYKKLFEELGLV